MNATRSTTTVLPHGEVPQDQRVKEAKEGGAEPTVEQSGALRPPDSSTS
ncbi:hypothetical protein B879_04195 [Cecembia lonarensis LW9]|uniref:Uncharacterized protein n=1 Tax=Cecembia lonarensis (strain CCUG 58316 / KCTC 22772 / LW9) TaxID=1225176 RepID=K1KXL1_CECL9|nr:hypothetical protein B879_04195 [Cecembia lonarensis LW9]